jgi:hypothetical protein
VAPECTLTERRAYELLDDELDDAERAAFDRHVADCAPCRARLAFARRFVGAVRRQRMRTAPAPESLRDRVDAALDAADRDAAARAARMLAGVRRRADDEAAATAAATAVAAGAGAPRVGALVPSGAPEPGSVMTATELATAALVAPALTAATMAESPRAPAPLRLGVARAE